MDFLRLRHTNEMKIPLKKSNCFFLPHTSPLIRYSYCYYRGELPTICHSRPRDCLYFYFEPYWWSENDFAIGWGHYLLSKSRHLTSPQMLMSENKWLLHLGNLAQSIKTFPNIISKTTQPDRLLAKQKIIYLFRVNQRTRVNMERLTSRTVNRTLRVTLNEYASYFESLDWCKHHVSDAFFEIVSQLFYYIFFQFL